MHCGTEVWEDSGIVRRAHGNTHVIYIAHIYLKPLHRLAHLKKNVAAALLRPCASQTHEVTFWGSSLRILYHYVSFVANFNKTLSLWTEAFLAIFFSRGISEHDSGTCVEPLYIVERCAKLKAAGDCMHLCGFAAVYLFSFFFCFFSDDRTYEG